VLGFFIACGFCVFEKRAARYDLQAKLRNKTTHLCEHALAAKLRLTQNDVPTYIDKTTPDNELVRVSVKRSRALLLACPTMLMRAA